MSGGTILGGPHPPELEERLKADRELEQTRSNRAGALMSLLLDGYTSGELSFELYARLVQTAINVNTPDKPNTRKRWLGEAIAAALAADRKNLGRGGRGVPKSIRGVALEILEAVVKREGLPLTRAPGNAFERCCELFTDAGYPGISPGELERWKWPKKASKTRD